MMVEQHLSYQTFFPPITTPETGKYQLTRDTYKLVSNLRRLGIYSLGSSLDVYLFIISLMVEPSFALGVATNPSILQIWKSMWEPNEYELVMKDLTQLAIRVSESDDYPTTDTLSTIILKRTLKCNILNHIWSQLSV